MLEVVLKCEHERDATKDEKKIEILEEYNVPTGERVDLYVPTLKLCVEYLIFYIEIMFIIFYCVRCVVGITCV